MKEILDTIILALVQGFTEFLPVSSSGHLSLFQHLFNSQQEDKLLVSVILHLGTLFSIIIAFRHTVWKLILEFFRLIKDIFTGKFKWKQMNAERRMIIMIIISILPLFVFYIFKDIFENIANDSDILIEGFAFIYTGILLLMTTKCMRGQKTAKDMKIKDALTIGFFQGLALVPGISRSGSTISSSLFCGIKRETAVEYSFILGIPVIAAGAFVELLDASKSSVNINWMPLSIGFLVSAIAGILAIKLVRWLIKSDKFKIFGYYTIILGIIVISIYIIEKITCSNIVDFIKI